MGTHTHQRTGQKENRPVGTVDKGTKEEYTVLGKVLPESSQSLLLKEMNVELVRVAAITSFYCLLYRG